MLEHLLTAFRYIGLYPRYVRNENSDKSISGISQTTLVFSAVFLVFRILTTTKYLLSGEIYYLNPKVCNQLHLDDGLLMFFHNKPTHFRKETEKVWSIV